MSTDKNKRIVAIVGSALALSGIGGSLAFAAGNATQPSLQPATPPITQAQPTTPAVTPVAPASTVDVPTAGDMVDTTSKDALTPGDKVDTTKTDRETADRIGQEGVENPAAEAAGSESAREPADERGLEPANSHQDAPGQNVDHRFQGVE